MEQIKKVSEMFMFSAMIGAIVELISPGISLGFLFILLNVIFFTSILLNKLRKFVMRNYRSEKEKDKPKKESAFSYVLLIISIILYVFVNNSVTLKLSFIMVITICIMVRIIKRHMGQITDEDDTNCNIICSIVSVFSVVVCILALLDLMK